jgi:hypothetical protein
MVNEKGDLIPQMVKEFKKLLKSYPNIKQFFGNLNTFNYLINCLNKANDKKKFEVVN